MWPYLAVKTLDCELRKGSKPDVKGGAVPHHAFSVQFKRKKKMFGEFC